MITGYFDPDYGNIPSKEKSEEIILQMLKNHDKINGGFLMVPLVKFGLYDTDMNVNITKLKSELNRVQTHLDKWSDFIAKTNTQRHSIRISHTDQDMLTITFPIYFENPTPLDKNKLLEKIEPILDLLIKSGLL